MRQPIVTRSILEFLHAIGDIPTEQFKSDILLDLMCFLRTRKSGDELASVAGRLNIGTRKVYNQNKVCCKAPASVYFAWRFTGK